MAKPSLPQGTRDFGPDTVRKRNYIFNTIRNVFELYSFQPLETPAMENIETLMGKYGEEGNQLIFKILKRGEHEKTGEADLALRYDLTVPLARVVAEYKNELPKFFKRYQIQPVWRADRPARGRFREFYQCDVDVLGSRSMVVESELCSAMSAALEKLGFDDFTIRVNHRQALTGMLDRANVPTDKHGDALVALDKLGKIGRDGVMQEFLSRGIAAESATELLSFFEGIASLEHVFRNVPDEVIEQAGSRSLNSTVLGRLLEFVGDHETGARGVDELRQILEFAVAGNIDARIKIDPMLARGLSYYTGTIMEIDVEGIGSLGGGGRYDNLVGMFSSQSVPACGFSLGLERIIVVMTERNMFPSDLASAPAEVMVTIWDDDSIRDSIALASELRRAGLRVDLYPEADKIGKQFKYASLRGIPFVVVMGADEKTRGEVALKDLRSGEQRSIARDDVALAVGEALAKD